jgi:hypothetical protein
MMSSLPSTSVTRPFSSRALADSLEFDIDLEVRTISADERALQSR